ncbi:hypothetical protein [Dyadobacter frigoris]|nr:hypothetical protein [Dyadobacter frigoris]
MTPIQLINHEDDQLPQWQMEVVSIRIEKYKNNPELMIDEDLALKMLDSE